MHGLRSNCITDILNIKGPSHVVVTSVIAVTSQHVVVHNHSIENKKVSTPHIHRSALQLLFREMAFLP